MQAVKVKTDALLITLKANRELHVGLFNDAMAGYREDVIEEMKVKLIDAEKEIDVVFSTKLTKPASHESDYDTAITMMEWSTEDSISLEEHEFERYVLDQWHWKGDFLRSQVMYNKRA